MFELKYCSYDYSPFLSKKEEQKENVTIQFCGCVLTHLLGPQFVINDHNSIITV